MAERVVLDTNVLLYAIDERIPQKQAVAEQVIALAQQIGALLPLIVLGEFFYAAPRKLGVSRAVARVHLTDFSLLFETRAYSHEHIRRGAVENEAGRFAFWDAVMLACAEEAGCTTCLSEDMQDGVRLGSLTVRNPFGPKGLSAAALAALNP